MAAAHLRALNHADSDLSCCNYRSGGAGYITAIPVLGTESFILPGMRLFSFTRAVAVVNFQSALACFLLRLFSRR